MSQLEALTTLLASDPVLAYSLAAALFLALVSLATGLGRGDAAVLVRPGVLLRVVLAVGLAFALAQLGEMATEALGGAGSNWALSGLRRFPLYLVALAYGPSVGLVGALLFAAFENGSGPTGWPAAVLGLELVVIGWLAIYPSPRNHRLAGPFNAVVGYALAWGTAGLALLAYRTGAVSGGGLWLQHRDAWLGLVLCTLLLALISPDSYRTLFPRSRIAPRPATRIVPREPALRTALERRGPRHDPSLTVPDLPQRYRRRDRVRELEPLSFDLEDDT